MNLPQNLPASIAHRTARVLVLDDDRNMREVISEALLLEGYDVEQATSLPEGLALLDQRWDAALIDVRLGSQSGLDFLRALREKQPDVVALVLTGFSTPNVALSALRAGADDYFGKPVDLEKLKIAVRRGIDRANAAAQNRALATDLDSLHERFRQTRALLARRGPEGVEDTASYFHILAEGAAHEIRSPLTALRTTLEVLRESQGIDANAGELIDYTMSEADKIERTLANLVMLIRPGGEPVSIDLTEILQTATRFAGEELARRGIVARVEPGEVAPVHADPLRLLRAVFDLLLFCMDRMKQGGTIDAQIRVDPEWNQAECRVADTGPSMSLEVLESIFEPPADASGSPGLAAARAIVESIGGQIWAECRPAGSVMLVFRVPLAEALDLHPVSPVSVEGSPSLPRPPAASPFRP